MQDVRDACCFVRNVGSQLVTSYEPLGGLALSEHLQNLAAELREQVPTHTTEEGSQHASMPARPNPSRALGLIYKKV